jgi:hypothetical protein
MPKEWENGTTEIAAAAVAAVPKNLRLEIVGFFIFIVLRFLKGVFNSFALKLYKETNFLTKNLDQRNITTVKSQISIYHSTLIYSLDQDSITLR